MTWRVNVWLTQGTGVGTTSEVVVRKERSNAGT